MNQNSTTRIEHGSVVKYVGSNLPISEDREGVIIGDAPNGDYLVDFNLGEYYLTSTKICKPKNLVRI